MVFFLTVARSSAALALLWATGCSMNWEMIDVSSVAKARVGFEMAQEHRKLHPPDEETPEKESSSNGSVFVGELLAIFPGMFVHGLGHYYARDYQTAARLRRIGEFGYIMTLVGAGTVAGGYFMSKNDKLGLAYGFYGTGGVIGVAGLAYFLTAWGYDMIDTPRAVESGGKPPPRSPLVESMDIFD